VAVEATVSSYDFTNADGDRIFGSSLSIREVYWLSEYQEDRENWPTTPTTNRKKRAFLCDGSRGRKSLKPSVFV
jgi:hypothetical protein